jgi:hypothetical protein
LTRTFFTCPSRFLPVCLISFPTFSISISPRLLAHADLPRLPPHGQLRTPTNPKSPTKSHLSLAPRLAAAPKATRPPPAAPPTKSLLPLAPELPAAPMATSPPLGAPAASRDAEEPCLLHHLRHGDRAGHRTELRRLGKGAYTGHRGSPRPAAEMQLWLARPPETGGGDAAVAGPGVPIHL